MVSNYVMLSKSVRVKASFDTKRAVAPRAFRFVSLCLLAKTEYFWVDLDMIALHSFGCSSEWAFSIENEREVDGAALNMCKDSKVLQKLLIFNE